MVGGKGGRERRREGGETKNGKQSGHDGLTLGGEGRRGREREKGKRQERGHDGTRET